MPLPCVQHQPSSARVHSSVKQEEHTVKGTAFLGLRASLSTSRPVSNRTVPSFRTPPRWYR